MKFKVSANVDYVIGHLRYGHYEGVVEAASEDELKEILKDPDLKYELDFIVDDYEIDGIGNMYNYKFEEIK